MNSSIVENEGFVQFIENDIDRPIIVGALYNGQGGGRRNADPARPAALLENIRCAKDIGLESVADQVL